jgi:hypothetical protein
VLVLVVIVTALDQVSPPKTEYQQDGLSSCIKHAQWCNVTVASLVCVNVVLKEAAKHSNCAARFISAYKVGARDERRNVARSSGTGNLGLSRLEQGVSDELA